MFIRKNDNVRQTKKLTKRCNYGSSERVVNAVPWKTEKTTYSSRSINWLIKQFINSKISIPNLMKLLKCQLIYETFCSIIERVSFVVSHLSWIQGIGCRIEDFGSSINQSITDQPVSPCQYHMTFTCWQFPIRSIRRIVSLQQQSTNLFSPLHINGRTAVHWHGISSFKHELLQYLKTLS